jgi:hypothetical protein
MPPRKAARGREQDRLFINLTLSGNVLYSSGEYAALTKQMADRFYQTQGSLTHALKIVAESINAFLIERNMKTTGQGQYNIGLLTLGALRGNDLYLVQSGQTRAFWINANGAQQFYDPQLAGRGLGLSQTTKLYYSKAVINSGDRIVLCAQAPSAWNDLLAQEKPSSNVDSLRRKLMTAADPNVNAVMIMIEAGSGSISLTSSTSPTGLTSSASPTSSTSPTAFANVAAKPAVPHIEPVLPKPEPKAIPIVESKPIITPKPAPAKKEEYAPEPKPLITKPKATNAIFTKERGQEYTRMAAKSIAKTIQGTRVIGEKIGNGINTMIPRLLPGTEDQAPSISDGWLALIAILVPILVVVIASAVYFGIGQPAQHDLYYQKAIAAFEETQTQIDPVERKRALQETLDWLDKADVYQETELSKALRAQAQNDLDAQERILRLNFKPAIAAALSDTVNITRMSASDTDLYMLNAIRGNVMRAMLTGTGYELDAKFRCEPGKYTNAETGVVTEIRKLIEVIALPKANPYDAAVLGIDDLGQLLYCAPDNDPQTFTLAKPELGLNNVTTAAYDAYSNNLYILDSTNNAVWTYFGFKTAEFPEAPQFFFNDQIPSDMNTVIDLAVNGDDLYMLHSNGHLTTCTLSRITAAPTRCQNPNYTDNRPGYISGPTLADGIFTEIVFTSPPNASIALLQSTTQAIYRFTPRTLELESQMRAYVGKQNPFPANIDIAAMTFSQNHILFVVVNGQVYYATDVP